MVREILHLVKTYFIVFQFLKPSIKYFLFVIYMSVFCYLSFLCFECLFIGLI